jgi:hypothetical protein
MYQRTHIFCRQLSDCGIFAILFYCIIIFQVYRFLSSLTHVQPDPFKSPNIYPSSRSLFYFSTIFFPLTLRSTFITTVELGYNVMKGTEYFVLL